MIASILKPHQIEAAKKAVECLKKNRLTIITAEERAMKTLPALASLNEMGFKNVLWISTVNAIKDVMKAHIELNTDYKLTGTSYESAHKYINLNPDAVVCDECHKLGQSPRPAKRLSTIQKICWGKFVILISATPTAEGYHKLFHILSASSFSPLTRFRNFYGFAKEFITVKMVMRNGINTPDYKDCNMNKLWPFISHLFITWTRKDAGFKIPETTVKVLRVPMSGKSVSIYNQLKRNKIYIDEEGDAAIANGGAELINRLHQVSSGTLILGENTSGKNEKPGKIIDITKAEFIRSFFFGKKIAIFYCYVAEGVLLRKFFPEWTDDADVFNASSDPNKVFIAQIVTASEGVSLWTADALVYYNIHFSATIWSQSKSRLLDFKREKEALAYLIFSEHGIEEKILKAVSEKRNFTASIYYEHERNKWGNTAKAS